MNNTKAYKLLLLEKECVSSRATCDKDCCSCPIGMNSKDITESLRYVLEILKARDPQLYFKDELEIIKEMIHNENQI